MNAPNKVWLMPAVAQAVYSREPLAGAVEYIRADAPRYRRATYDASLNPAAEAVHVVQVFPFGRQPARTVCGRAIGGHTLQPEIYETPPVTNCMACRGALGLD